MATWYTGTIWRGVDYSPTWPTWVVGAANTQTNDSDFANDAFAQQRVRRILAYYGGSGRASRRWRAAGIGELVFDKGRAQVTDA